MMSPMLKPTEQYTKKSRPNDRVCSCIIPCALVRCMRIYVYLHKTHNKYTYATTVNTR
jgi:hypothetical protein